MDAKSNEVFIMAFEQFKLDRSFNQTRNIFDQYIYKTGIDPIDVVKSAGYFDESRFSSDKDWVGSLITCKCSDGVINAKIDQDGTISGITTLTGRVNVINPIQLSGTLDPTKEYFLDGIIDFTGTGLSIEVPQGGLNLRGYNFDISGLKCDDAAYTLFTSPVGGSGNILGADYLIDVNGVGSQVYNLTSDTGFEAFEFSRINYNNRSSLGEITNYRQGLENGTGRFGGSPSLTLTGVWSGGYRITTSIVRTLSAGMTEPLFKAGAGFLMSSRFLTDINVDLPTNAAMFDFSPVNFSNPSTVQVVGAIVTRNGAFDSTDPNITPNMAAGDLVATWKENNGMPNTFEGGSIGVTTEMETSISGVGAFVDIAAALWTGSDFQHFDNPAGGQIRHLGNSPREYKVIASFALDSNQNDEVTLRVSKWDNSAASFSVVLDQTRQINSFAGGRDVGFFDVNINTTLDQNDYIVLQVANQSGVNNITAETDSYMIVEER